MRIQPTGGADNHADEILRAWPMNKTPPLTADEASVHDICQDARSERPRGATVARLTPDQKVACSNHVGVKNNLFSDLE